MLHGSIVYYTLKMDEGWQTTMPWMWDLSSLPVFILVNWNESVSDWYGMCTNNWTPHCVLNLALGRALHCCMLFVAWYFLTNHFKVSWQFRLLWLGLIANKFVTWQKAVETYFHSVVFAALILSKVLLCQNKPDILSETAFACIKRNLRLKSYHVVSFWNTATAQC